MSPGSRKFTQAACALKFRAPLALLVMGRLSAQCTDAGQHYKPRFIQKYPGAAAMAAADIAERDNTPRRCRTKARDIKAASAAICERFGGHCPNSMEDLLTLPGVGRKLANLLLGISTASRYCRRYTLHQALGRFGMYPET